MPRTYYMIGSLTWQTEASAKELARSHAPALATQESNGTWTVYYLDTKARAPGLQRFNHEVKGQDLLVKRTPAKPASKPKTKLPWAV